MQLVSLQTVLAVGRAAAGNSSPSLAVSPTPPSARQPGGEDFPFGVSVMTDTTAHRPLRPARYEIRWDRALELAALAASALALVRLLF